MIILFKAAFLLSLGIFFVPKSWKQLYSVKVCLMLARTVSVWAWTAFQSKEALVIDLGISFWKENPFTLFCPQHIVDAVETPMQTLPL